MTPLQRGGFDCDGVLCELHPAAFSRLQLDGHIPPEFVYEDYKHLPWFEYNEKTGEGIPGLTIDRIRTMCLDPDFWIGLPAYSYASYITNLLAGLGVENHIVTDRRWYFDLKHHTKFWLDVSMIDYEKLSIVHRKDKGIYAEQFKLDWFVEDTPDNVRAIAPFVSKVYLIKRSWNVNYITDLPDNVFVGTDMEVCDQLINNLVS